MRRILGAAALLLIFGTVWGGCQDRRKEEIPTHIEKLPKEQPRPVEDRSPL